VLLPSSEQRARMLPPIARETQMAFAFVFRQPLGDEVPTLRQPLGDGVPTLRQPLGDEVPTLSRQPLGDRERRSTQSC